MPSFMVKMPPNTPIPPTHLGKTSCLIAIAMPKIIAVAPWSMRNMLASPITVHLIPSATRNANTFSCCGAAAHESTALFSEIPSTVYSTTKVLAVSIVTARPNYGRAETRPDSDDLTKKR
jgi:hypothetical protein